MGVPRQISSGRPAFRSQLGPGTQSGLHLPRDLGCLNPGAKQLNQVLAEDSFRALCGLRAGF